MKRWNMRSKDKNSDCFACPGLFQDRCNCPPPDMCPPPCPPIPPCPVPEKGLDFYAQFFMQTNVASESNLPMVEVFHGGEGIYLENPETIVLKPGYVYWIEYLFQITVDPPNDMQIIPGLNGRSRYYYGYLIPPGGSRYASASGGFITNEAIEKEARLTFKTIYPEEVERIDISGTVSVTPVIKVQSQGEKQE